MLKGEEGTGSEFVVELPDQLMESAACSMKENSNTGDYIEKINVEFSDIYR